MKKLSIFAIAILLISTFAPLALAAGPTQPPVATDTLYQATIGWGPRRADPQRAYDTGSGELTFNVYDNLIDFGEPVTNAYKSNWEVEEQYWAFQPDLAINVPDRQELVQDFHGLVPIVPPYLDVHLEAVPPDGKDYIICGYIDNNPDGVLGPCDVLYISEWMGPVELTCRTWHVLGFDLVTNTLHLHRFYYDFIVRTDPVYVNELGVVVDNFDEFDVQYSIWRGLIQDQYGSPMWMYYKPLFDQMNSDAFDDAWCLAYLIKDAVEILPGHGIRINVGIAFPDAAFKQILAQQWGAILSKEFSISIGCWNGDLFEDVAPADGVPDWYVTWRHISRSPYDTVGANRYVGTGPYRVIVLDPVAKIVIFERNPLYWKGWPCIDRKTYLEHIEEWYIADWAPRRDDFIASNYDVAAVPRAYMNELLDLYGEPKYPEIKTIKKISPVLAMDALHYTFTVDPTSGYIGSGHLDGDGVPPDFFNNTNVRKAFSYGFDRAKYLAEAWFSEAICRETPLIFGLVPDYYTLSPDPPWTYNYNQAAAEAMLMAANFPEGNVWEKGFSMTMSYNTGNDQRRIACYYIRDFFGNLSTYDGRVGDPFTVLVTEIDWPTYLTLFEEYKLPIWSIGWAADFADADNWDRPYMHSWGDFSYFQNYTLDNGWGATHGTNNPGMNKDELIDLAVKTPDGPGRAGMYADLDLIYIADCPSLPIDQALGRRWAKYWVKGWQFQTMWPASYYYKMYKEDACWGDVTGPTVGIPDGVENMRDVGYIAGHFGAVAPNPAAAVEYDARWAPGTYGYAGCDVYGDRKVDMRDIGFACAHFGHLAQP